MDVEVVPGLFENLPNNLSLRLVPGSQIEEDATGMTRVEREDNTIPGYVRESIFEKLRLNRQYRVGFLISRLGIFKPERGADRVIV